MFVKLIAEMAKEFTMQLGDTVAIENTDASFTCETNDDEADVTWMLDKKPLPDTDKYKTRSEGVTHSLTIHDITPSDSCEVSATFGDQTTSANLVVEGKGNVLKIGSYCESVYLALFHFQLQSCN